MNAEAYRWRCACCGLEMTGLPMDIAFSAPVDWESLDENERANAWFDDDFCVVPFASGATDRFIRCVLALPVPRLAAEFRFGVWMSVSEASWNAYAEGFASGLYSVDACFGYLMHEIPEYPGSFLLHADVRFQADLRPTVVLHDADHPLAEAQRHGIEPRQIARWMALMHEREKGEPD